MPWYAMTRSDDVVLRYHWLQLYVNICSWWTQLTSKLQRQTKRSINQSGIF